MNKVFLTSQTEESKLQEGMKRGCWQQAVPVSAHTHKCWQYKLTATNISDLSMKANILYQILKCDLYQFPMLA